MKKTFLTAAFSIITVVAFAQKKEIRNAGRAIDKGNYTEAKSLINQAEGAIAGEKEKVQADFYYTKGLALLGPEGNNNYEDLIAGTQAMEKAKQLGSKEADQGLAIAKNRLVSSAVADQNKQNFKNAAEKLLASYNLDKRDTLYLFYAASNYVNAKDYDNALTHYLKLRDLGYKGEEIEYLATNVNTGEVESFSKSERDLLVKSPQYNNPEDKTSPPKTGEIARNIALIYIQNGDNDKAVVAMEEAKKSNPDDVNLMMVEADMYYNLGETKKYKALMERITQKDPDNPVLFYNLGVSSAQMGDDENAIKYYTRALELDPSMADARLNLAYSILAGDKAIVEEMNSLGTSKAENEKYDKLSKQRIQIYKDALPHLKSASELNPKNVEAYRTMMNIYYQIDEPQNAEKMKAKIAELEAGQ